MNYVQHTFYVSCTIKINGIAISTKTWTSTESYDHCYDKINTFIRKNKKDGDTVVTDIISANHS